MSPVPAPEPVDPDGGGGGLQVVSFDFAHDTPGLTAGVTVWTPAVGDVLLDAFVFVTTAFNGTTPKFDIGTFVGTNNGLFYQPWDVVDIAAADDEPRGAGVLLSEITPRRSISSSWVAAAASSGALEGAANAWQGVFTAANPLKLVVSQDGAKGGTAIGGTTGAGTLYLMVVTPTAA